MKKFILLTLMACVAEFTNAQVNKHAFYIGTDVAVGNMQGAFINLNYLYDQKYIIQTGYHYGIIFSNTEFNSSHHPASNQLSSATIMVGKMFHLGNDRKVRPKILAGLAFSQVTEGHIEYENATPGTRPGSSIVNEYFSVPSLVLNFGIEVPLNDYYGFSLGFLSLINKKDNFYGMTFGQNLGVLRYSTIDQKAARKKRRAYRKPRAVQARRRAAREEREATRANQESTLPASTP